MRIVWRAVCVLACMLLLVRCWLFVVVYDLLDGVCCLFGVCCWWCVGRCLWFVVRCCLLCVVCGLVFVVRCLNIVVCVVR